MKNTAVIIGFGAIGKIVYNYLSEKRYSEILIYGGRNINKLHLAYGTAHFFSGRLDCFVEHIDLPRNRNIEIYWCCGPDYFEETDGLQDFLRLVIDCPLKMLRRLEENCDGKFVFVHFSTMAGFDCKKVAASQTSFLKKVDVSKPYPWAKMILDCTLENQNYAGRVFNLRLSHLLASDHLSSKRKVIIRMVKKLKCGYDIEVSSKSKLDFITKEHITSTLDLICSDSLQSGSHNICNGKQFSLYHLLDGVRNELKKQKVKVGRILENDDFNSDEVNYEPCAGIIQLTLEDFLKEVNRLV